MTLKQDIGSGRVGIDGAAMDMIEQSIPVMLIRRPPAEVEAYIRDNAAKHGLDPDVAVSIYRAERVDTHSTTMTTGEATVEWGKLTDAGPLMEAVASLPEYAPIAPTIEWRFIPSRKLDVDGTELRMMGMTEGWVMFIGAAAKMPCVMSQDEWEALDDVKG